MLKIGIPLFEIDDKHTYKFKERDPFNNNVIEGYINRRPGSLYGSLFITKVNDRSVNQFIFSTPKMSYPYNRKGEWDIPNANEIRIYEKLDGTNIMSYVYEDANGNQYLTYKTRMRPILGESRFGNFLSLWEEVLDMYPEIKDISYDPNRYFSYELYGKKNKIYILYKEMIDTRLLFWRDNSGFIHVPDTYKDRLPVVDLLKSFHPESEEQIKMEYINFKDYLQTKLVDTPEGIMGIEGAVWYFVNGDRAIQMKCKPPKIEDIHHRKMRIPYHSIYITIMNAFENVDEKSITTEFIKELLREEFSDVEIEQSSNKIDKILRQVLEERGWQKQVIEDYEMLQMKYGWTIKDNKGEVMRWIGKHYPKSLSGKIYRFLNEGE